MSRVELPAGDGPDVVRALRLVPHFVDAVNAQEAAVWASPMSRRTHELVRIRIAQINGCTLCLTWRNGWAEEDDLAEVADYATSTRFDDAERAAIEYADRFCTDSTSIDDSLMARLAEHFTPAEIVDLTLVIGKYLAMGRFMQVLDLDQACTISYDENGKLVSTSSA